MNCYLNEGICDELYFIFSSYIIRVLFNRVLVSGLRSRFQPASLCAFLTFLLVLLISVRQSSLLSASEKFLVAPQEMCDVWHPV